MNWGDFFAMGGYATYVWGAYGVSVIVLVLNIVIARWRAANTHRTLVEFYRAKRNTE